MSRSPSPARPGLSAAPVTAVILAGGLGRRMGHVDKGLQLLDGSSLVSRVLQRLAPQAAEVLINANRNREMYAAMGYRVIADQFGEFAGPLAGMHAGLSQARHERIAFVPCDTPFLPEDLVARLLEPLRDEGVDLVVARSGTRVHPVICLARKRLLAHLSGFLEGGGRKVDAWYSTLRVVEVDFFDQADAFRNLNTPQDLEAASDGGRG